MKPRIQGHTRGERWRYRGLKLALGISLVPLAMLHLAGQVAPPKTARFTPMPIVTTDEAMRTDYPLRWAKGGRGPLRKMGKHVVLGRGPSNADVFLYSGDAEVARTKTNASGRWHAQITLDRPGLKTFRADYRRNRIGQGHSRPLAATVLDPKSHGKSDVKITNLQTNDRVLAGFFTLRGSAPPGDFVQIYIDATMLGRAEVDLAGRWSFKPRVNAGGRRTFTIVDEITERQFGPLPIFIVGKKAPIAPKVKVKPTVKAKPVVKAKPKPKLVAKSKAPVKPVQRVKPPKPIARSIASVKAKPKTLPSPKHL